MDGCQMIGAFPKGDLGCNIPPPAFDDHKRPFVRQKKYKLSTLEIQACGEYNCKIAI